MECVPFSAFPAKAQETVGDDAPSPHPLPQGGEGFIRSFLALSLWERVG